MQNSRVSTVTSARVRCAEPVDENEHGEELREMAAVTGLFLENTSHEAGRTWKGAFHLMSRIDHIGLGEKLHTSVLSCFVDEKVELATAIREDH